MTGNERIGKLASIGLIALALELIAAGPAPGLEIRMSASRDQVAVGEQFTVSVEVRHGGVGSVPEPTLPPVESVRQVSNYKSTSFSYVNGKMTASVVVQYVMVADEVGTYTIGPATVEKDREQAVSNAVSIEVAPAGSSATVRPKLGEGSSDPDQDAGKDLIVLGNVDNPNPYVNQQITYTFTFLRRIRVLEGSRYSPPATTGFWSEELDSTEPTEVVVEGRRYYAERVRTALFPTGDGEFTIGAATLNATVEDRRRGRRRGRDPFDIFDRDPFGLLRSGRPVVLQTDPITVQVRPLPKEGKPVDFSGAVGRFSLSASVDRAEVKAGEPVTLSVVFQGEGNVKVVPAPDLSILEDFKIYESQSSESSQARSGKIMGRKTWEFVLVPTSGGEVTIPPVRLAAFDPGKGEYVTHSTRPITLSVEATDLDDALARGDDLQIAKERVRLRQRDIRYIKPVPERLRSSNSSPFSSPGFLLAHFVPALAMAGTSLLRRHRDKLRSDTRYARSRGAARVASKRLKSSQEALAAGDLERFFGELALSLRGFVADKLHLAAANLEEEAVRVGLAEQGVPPESIETLFRILADCDSARFSPLGSDPVRAAALLEEAREWISRAQKR